MEQTTSDGPPGKDEAQAFNPQLRCRITVVSYRHRDTDPDGISAKALIDGLVSNGILAGDSSKQVEQFASQVKIIKKEEVERTEILIDYL